LSYKDKYLSDEIWDMNYEIYISISDNSYLKMYTFYPGPSKLYPEVEKYLHDAFQSGILQANHRSLAFMDMMQETIKLLHQKLEIPSNYEIYFVSSATECWEIISQSLVQEQSSHFFNGAFGEKWFEYSKKINPKNEAVLFDIDDVLPEILSNQELICLTHNETSNGTQITIPKNNRSSLIAIDATSSMAGVELDWKNADIWFASVQKCFGLPAGLALLICSAKAMKKATEINEQNHYNSLLFIQENHKKYQTHYTPNVLNIYLLMRVMQEIEPISLISKKIKERAANFYDFIDKKTDLKPLIQNAKVRSDTVLVVENEKAIIKNIKSKALSKNIILGNGYGQWKDNTFRIANFPAIKDHEFKKLIDFLT
jgi:phosphoserine aminotransferase